MNNVTDYQVFRATLEGLDLKMVGEGLRRFVQSSTGCTLQHFEEVYQEIQETWVPSSTG